MRHIAVFAAALLVATMTGGADAEPRSHLTVRVYNSMGLPAADIMQASAIAEPILRDAGMDLRFRQCGISVQPDGSLDRCNDRLSASEVVVRIIDAPHFSLTLQPHVFGVAYLMKGSTRGAVATLFADRIADASARVRVEAGTLLGRVLAHEVGHLLLGTDYHGPSGLMRADWSDDLLHRDAATEWRFSRVEAVTMQHQLAASLRE